MELVVSLYPYDRWGSVDDMVEAAALADRLGIHGLSFADHVVAPVGGGATEVGRCWYDAITLASNVAARTERLRLYFYVIVATYRNPVILAKQISTLDTLSHGRVTLAVGSGWFEQEFDILGVPFDDRGGRMDEYVAAMKALWTQEAPSFEGEYVSFSDLAFLPRCAQEPHVPLYIGGSGPRPLARVVAEGDGWAPMLGAPEEISQSLAWIKERRPAAERFPVMFSMQVGEGDEAVKAAFEHAGEGAEQPSSGLSTDRTAAALAAMKTWADAGVTHMLVVFGWEDPAQYADQLRWLADEVVPQAAGL